MADARRQGKPIFLSIGYASCYWCHVAQRELFSNPQIAADMNAWFINIKVDREEHPDLDSLYQLATEILNDTSGWPNNLFLTPEEKPKPFQALGYVPPVDHPGKPGFSTILRQVHAHWNDDSKAARAEGERVYTLLGRASATARRSRAVPIAPRDWLAAAASKAATHFDRRNGGFHQGTLQFPQPPLLEALLASSRRMENAEALAQLEATLIAMAEGGVMDQLGGGFHRYASDPEWSIPHFEKMLSDNAQLLGLYSRTFAVTGNPFYAAIARRTAEFLLRDMRGQDGTFSNALDAEADGREGSTYVWTRQQIEDVLGVQAAADFLSLYALVSVPEAPQFCTLMGTAVLRLDWPHAQDLLREHRLADQIDRLSVLRERLRAARGRRPQPARDPKSVTANNALAITGFTDAAIALRDPALLAVAAQTADSLWRQAFDASEGILWHQVAARGHGGEGLLDDYGELGLALLAIHRNPPGDVWLARARRVCDATLERFSLPDNRLAESRNASLLVVPPPQGDAVVPSGWS